MAFLKSITLLSLVAVQTLALNAPIPGYGVVDLQWDVQVKAGEPSTNFTGTVQQVFAELTERHPEWKRAVEARHSNLVERGEVEKILCDSEAYDWSRAREGPLLQGIEYLRQLPGRPGNSPGPGTCGRVSCSWDSAIWWCNDNDHGIELDSFKEIGDAAAAIMKECQVGQEVLWTKGQAFMVGNWNVIVRGDAADC